MDTEPAPAAEAAEALPAIVAEPPPDPVLAMIERAARDPSVDIEKFERLMKLKERAEAREASIAFAVAFTALGPDLPVIDRRGRIVVYSKAERERPGGPAADAQPIQRTPYATLDDILEAIRPALHKHGFSLRFEHSTSPDGRLVTTAILRHASGHEERAETPPLQHDSTGSKNAVQAVGSALTYGRRYALMAVLPIVSHATEDADDDGDKAGAALIDVDQVAYIEQLLRDTASDRQIFLETFQVDAVDQMNVAKYQQAVSKLMEKKRRQAQGAAHAAKQP